jgi:hypothetical protein
VRLPPRSSNIRVQSLGSAQPVTGFDHHEFENLIKLMKKRNVVECDRAGVAGGSLRLTLDAQMALDGAGDTSDDD